MTPRTLKIALAASLAVNVFVIGAGVGAVANQARFEHQQRAPRSMGNPLMRAGAGLPEAKRQAYIARLRQEGQASHADFRTAREDREKASALIAAPQYDPAAVAALLAQARSLDIAARARFETAVIEFARGLTPEERKTFAENLKPQRGMGGGGRGPGGGRHDARGEPAGPPPPR